MALSNDDMVFLHMIPEPFVLLNRPVTDSHSYIIPESFELITRPSVTYESNSAITNITHRLTAYYNMIPTMTYTTFNHPVINLFNVLT
jgi:hypothetical protein